MAVGRGRRVGVRVLPGGGRSASERFGGLPTKLLHFILNVASNIELVEGAERPIDVPIYAVDCRAVISISIPRLVSLNDDPDIPASLLQGK